MHTTLEPQPLAISPSASVKNLPVNLFGAVMGLAGLSLAWRLASKAFGASTLIAELIGVVAMAVFVALVVGHLLKWIKHPDTVAAEFNHPIIGNFYGTITISVLLVSTLIGTYSALLQEATWAIGTVLTLVLSLASVGRLLKGNIDADHAVPAWLIPGVATLDIAVAGGSLPMAWVPEVNLFATSAGTVIAIVFFTMIFSRLVHKAPLAPAMIPSMMILTGPFEVGFLAYVNVNHSVDTFAGLLFYFGLFLFVVLAVIMLRARPRFSPGWWAISFPIAALSNAAFKYVLARDTVPLHYLAGVILAIATVTIAVLFVRTAYVLVSGKLLQG